MSILHQFRGNQGGFGLQSYNRARAAGLNPIHIANAIGPSGLSLGWRARDAIIRDSAAQAFQLKAQRNQARSVARDYSGEIERYKQQIGDYERRVGDYENRIQGFNDQIANYTNQVNTLTGQYQNALKTAEANAQARDQFEAQFKQASADFEAARAEADQYREEAVGQQLRAVRSGSTVGGANQSQNLTGGLTSGRTGYSSDEGDISKLAESMRAQGGLTDSVLSREGPVVQQLSRGGQRPGQSASKGSSSSAGTGSYYASRFR